jgi:hypothetical protein
VYQFDHIAEDLDLATWLFTTAVFAQNGEMWRYWTVAAG